MGGRLPIPPTCDRTRTLPCPFVAKFRTDHRRANSLKHHQNVVASSANLSYRRRRTNRASMEPRRQESFLHKQNRPAEVRRHWRATKFLSFPKFLSHVSEI